MTDTPNTAPTPEELAARVGWPHESGMRLCGEKDIATAIRSHSAPLKAQIAGLTAENERLRDDFQRQYDMTVKELNERGREFADMKARATTAEAALSDLPRLIAVTRALTGDPMDDPHGYTLADCIATLEEHEQDVAGIGWQIGLTGETERADRAEKAVTHHATSASRHERLWRTAMRGMAKHRAALSTAQEREKAMREALERIANGDHNMIGFGVLAKDVARAALATKETEAGNG